MATCVPGCMGWQPLPSPCSADRSAGRTQAVQGCLQEHSTKPDHSNSQVMQGQKALPDAHGEVGIHISTTMITFMPGRAHPAKEGLRVEAQTHGSHNQLLGCQLYFCMSPLSHTAVPHPQGQVAQGSLALEKVMLAVCRILGTHLRSHTRSTTGQCPSDNFSPKGLVIKRHTNRSTLAPGCASTTSGKRSRAGLRLGAREGLAFANEPPQVKSSIQRQLVYRKQFPDQKRLLNFHQ